MAIKLPTERLPASNKSPKRMFIFGPPKTGKTTAVAMLDDCLLIDLERGSDFVDSMRVQANNLTELREVLKEVNKAGNPYKYAAIDTTTKLEEMVLPLAAELYRDTQMGKDWDGDNVLTLAKGAGYLYLRRAFMKVMEAIDKAFPRVIYLGHLKDSSLSKEGKEVAVRDIALTGQLKNMVCASTDAIAYIFRKDNEAILSFESEETVISGARPIHLRNKQIPILTSDDAGNLTAHWDKIYID